MSNSPQAADPSAEKARRAGSYDELLSERNRLRTELNEARRETFILRCRAEILRQEWFAAKLQEEEYRQLIKKIMGADPQVAPEELLDAEKSRHNIDDILEELDKDAQRENTSTDAA